MRKNAVIYSRVSSLNDRQNAERQIADLTQFADRNDFTILEIFSEKISGAKKNEERVILTNCLEYCVVNRVDTLLLSELSRLGRNNYIANGGKLGRKAGSIKTLEKKKEEYKDVIRLLKLNYSIRNVAKLANCSISTVQRIKKTFEIQKEEL